MKQWVSGVIQSPKKKAMPILSFPAVQLLGISVRELISDGETQAKAMKAVAGRVPSLASVSLMDLSVEAECFGAQIKFSDFEVPTVTGKLIETPEDADALEVPAMGSGRTGIYVGAIGKAVKMITDRPVLAGIIGPFSLAGRLVDVTEAMILCYEDPDMLHALLEKVVSFSIEYARSYKAVGADGVIIAEPLAGMLSPALCEEFSSPYVRKIVEAVQDDSFIVVYHNCGNNTVKMLDSLLSVGAAGYHFGNAVSMRDVMPNMPENVLAFGNVDPAGQLRNGTPESVREATLAVMNDCADYKNFVISSGCDIPPLTPWENIDAFFKAVEAF